MRQIHMVLGLLLAFLLGEELALAQGGEAQPGPERTLSPYFVVAGADEGSEPFPLELTTARVRIAGVIADVTVTQSYHNRGRTPIEATYLFPASTRAAVHGMTMTIGERVVTARIAERARATAQYEQAKKEGKSASLLEQHRPNVFQMHVANIMPGDLVKVELTYTELLVPEEGVYELVYPTVVGPRYSNRPDPGEPSEHTWTRNPTLHAGSPAPYGFDIRVDLAGAVPISDVLCLNHKVDISFPSATEAAVTLDPAEHQSGDRDFVLRYRLAGAAIQTGLLVEPGPEESFFLLMVQPPRHVTQAQVTPREYVFIVDVSGSMGGFPIGISKQLLRDLLHKLRPTDRFNVVLFAGGSAILAPQSLEAIDTNLKRALQVVDQQTGGGGTELVPALKRALALPTSPGYARSFVLLTDGYVDVEQEAFTLVSDNLDKASFFAFGIGSSVNRFLIEGLARAGQGEPFVVTAEAEAEEATARFVRYVESPVLLGGEVDLGSFAAYDVEPRHLPAMFAERPLVVLGKYRGAPQGSISVRGSTAAGPWHANVDMGQATRLEGRSLAHLWARQRIAALSDFCQIAASPESVNEVTALGLRYSLLTRYTSFVAVDTVVRRTTDDLKKVEQPLPLPQGVSDLAVGGTVPTTPEPETWLLISVVATLLGAVMMRKVLA